MSDQLRCPDWCVEHDGPDLEHGDPGVVHTGEPVRVALSETRGQQSVGLRLTSYRHPEGERDSVIDVLLPGEEHRAEFGLTPAEARQFAVLLIESADKLDEFDGVGI